MFLSRLKPTLYRVSTKLTFVYSLVLILSSILIFSFLYLQMSRALEKQEQVILEAKAEEYRNRIDLGGMTDFEKSFVQNRAEPTPLVTVISPRGEMTFFHESSPFLRWILKP